MCDKTGKGIYEQSIAKIILNVEKLNIFPLGLGTKQGCLLPPLLFNIVLEVWFHWKCSQARKKKITGNQTGKEVNCLYMQKIYCI